MEVIDHYLYTKEHEWVNIEEDVAIIGISEYAQDHRIIRIVVESLARVAKRLRSLPFDCTSRAPASLADHGEGEQGTSHRVTPLQLCCQSSLLDGLRVLLPEQVDHGPCQCS